MKITKTDKGSFIWKVVNKPQAMMIFDNNIFNLYELREDDSESLIDTKEMFDNLMYDAVLAIEVGYLENK